MTGAISTGPTLDSLPDGLGQVVDSTLSFEQPSPSVVEVSRAPSQQPKADEPQLILGKFKTQADLEAAYRELERKQSQPAPKAEGEAPKAASEKPSDLKMGEQPDTSKDAEAEAAEAKPEAATTQLDFAALGTEFAENGALSEATYETLNKQGIGKDVVDLHIAGLQAIQTLNGQKVYEAAGGKDAFESLVKWGTTNLNPAEHTAFNNAINIAILQGDPTAASLLIQGIKAKMGGGEPNYVQTENRLAEGVQGYASRAEMSADMSRPEYSRDPAFVAHVQKRLAATSAF